MIPYQLEIPLLLFPERVDANLKHIDPKLR